MDIWVQNWEFQAETAMLCYVYLAIKSIYIYRLTLQFSFRRTAAAVAHNFSEFKEGRSIFVMSENIGV